MNEERPVEKLLRRFAKKRRDAAGSPREMHPATRRMLQGEVARRFPDPSGNKKNGFDAFVAFFARRWTYAVGTFLILVVSVLLLTPVLKKEPAPMNLAAANETSLSVAKMDQVSTPRPSSTDSFVASSEMLLDMNENRSRTVPAAAPVSAAAGAGSVVREASGSIEAGSKRLADGSADASNLGTTRLEKEKLAANRDGLRENFQDKQLLARGGGGILKAESQTAQNFFRQSYANDIPAPSRLAKIAEDTKVQTTVLSNFQIEQNGNEVTVIDADGSTYNGTVANALAEDSKRSDSFGLAEKNSQQPVSNNSTDGYGFRVVGTNRTLNQQVVFAWNYIPLTNATAVTNGRFATEEISTINSLNRLQQFPGFQNSYLNGRAQISTDKEIEINARPVSP
jgi:hypothetical protein